MIGRVALLLAVVAVAVASASRSGSYENEHWWQCKSSETTALVFVANDTTNDDAFYQHDKPLDAHCPWCANGGEAGSDWLLAGRRYQPETFGAGSFVAGVLNCDAPNETCIRDADGRYWRGYGPEGGHIYVTLFTDCRPGKKCVVRAVIDPTEDSGQPASGTPSDYGLQAVTGGLSFSSANEFQNSGKFKPLSTGVYPVIRAISCNSCSAPFGCGIHKKRRHSSSDSHGYRHHH